jgi:hypothetical protein
LKIHVLDDKKQNERFSQRLFQKQTSERISDPPDLGVFYLFPIFYKTIFNHHKRILKNNSRRTYPQETLGKIGKIQELRSLKIRVLDDKKQNEIFCQRLFQKQTSERILDPPDLGVFYSFSMILQKRSPLVSWTLEVNGLSSICSHM